MRHRDMYPTMNVKRTFLIPATIATASAGTGDIPTQDICSAFNGTTAGAEQSHRHQLR